MRKGMNYFQANICLICVTLCWSAEVIIYACIPSDVLPVATMCITYLIGAGLIFLSFFKRIRSELSVSRGKLIKRCLFLSALNCAYNTMYIIGYSYFDVSTGAFTSALTVAVLPVVLLSMGQHLGKKTWASVMLVLAGIVIALCSSFNETNVAGLLIMIAACFIRAVFIIKLNSYAKENDPVAISGFIAVFVGAISFVIWLFLQPETFAAVPWTKVTTASLFIYAYFIVVFAQTLNIFAHKRATAVGSTIIYSLEIVFTLVLTLVIPPSVIGHIDVTPFHIVGAALIVIGNIIEVIRPLKKSGAVPAEEVSND